MNLTCINLFVYLCLSQTVKFKGLLFPFHYYIESPFQFFIFVQCSNYNTHLNEIHYLEMIQASFLSSKEHLLSYNLISTYKRKWKISLFCICLCRCCNRRIPFLACVTHMYLKDVALDRYHSMLVHKFLTHVHPYRING